MTFTVEQIEERIKRYDRRGKYDAGMSEIAEECAAMKRREAETCWTCGNQKHEGSCVDPKWATAAMCDKLLAQASPPSRPSTGVPDVVSEVLAEVERAIAKFPTWPSDPLHAAGVLNEEVGELNKAVLQQMYEPHKNKPGDVRKEAMQAAAMTLRFIASLDVYDWSQGKQHDQFSINAEDPKKCDAWSCNNGFVVGPYDHEMVCSKCNGTGFIAAAPRSP